MKRRITLQGCDGQTWMEANFTSEQVHLLEMIAEAINTKADCKCNPQMKITTAGTEYNKYHDTEYKH